MKAVVLAGGLGTRLYPLTRKIAKSMLPVAGRPLFEYLILHLKRHGFREIVLTLGSKRGEIVDYFGDGSKYGVKLLHSVERRPLGTAGSFRNAAKYLDQRSLVVQGDLLTNFDLARITSFHARRKAMVTIALKSVRNPAGYGIAKIDRAGKIARFAEKPRRFFSNLANAGIYVVEREALDLIPKNRFFDFSKNLFPAMLEKRLPLYGIKMRGYWFDIGTPESYRRAEAYMLRRK